MNGAAVLGNRILSVIAIGVVGTILLAGCGTDQPIGRVFFLEPRDGAEVNSPFTVKMGVEALVIEPAREDSNYEKGHGHHHIIVDADLPTLDLPIPSESVQHLHYGKGQLEDTLDLEPGEHTLRLLFAKGDHVPWSPSQSDSITVTVVE